MNLKDIVFESGNYFVLKAKHGFEIYKSGTTHSTRCAIIGYEGEIGMDKAIREILKRKEIEKYD